MLIKYTLHPPVLKQRFGVKYIKKYVNQILNYKKKIIYIVTGN